MENTIQSQDQQLTLRITRDGQHGRRVSAADWTPAVGLMRWLGFPI
jgi:hypothetical protein